MQAGTFIANVVMALTAAGAPAPSGASWLAGRWPTILVAAVIAVVVIFFFSVLAKYLRLTVNLFLDTPLPVPAMLHNYDPPEGEVVSFPSRDGWTLRGMFINPPGRGPDRGTVIFCHEFASDMASAGRYACPLVEAGFTVFRFDCRGHGLSFTPPHFEPRHWPSHYEVNDVLAAIAYVRSRRDISRTGVGILGVSRGGAAAVMAAALNPFVRCLVLDGVFSTDYSIEELMKRWARIFSRINLARANHPNFVYRFLRALTLLYVELKCRCRFPSTRKALEKLGAVPALFICGERDTYVLPEQVRALYELKPGEKDLWICPEAKHNQAVASDPKQYAERITVFFSRHLSASESADDVRPARRIGGAG